MSDSVRPHRWQPTRLPRPWDSPGKNTGVGCHFLLQCMKVESEKWKWSRSVVSNSSRPHGLQPARLLHPCDFPSKSTRVGCHCLLRILIISCNKFHVPWIILTQNYFKVIVTRFCIHCIFQLSFINISVWNACEFILCPETFLHQLTAS